MLTKEQLNEIRICSKQFHIDVAVRLNAMADAYEDLQADRDRLHKRAEALERALMRLHMNEDGPCAICIHEAEDAYEEQCWYCQWFKEDSYFEFDEARFSKEKEDEGQ